MSHVPGFSTSRSSTWRYTRIRETPLQYRSFSLPTETHPLLSTLPIGARWGLVRLGCVTIVMLTGYILVRTPPSRKTREGKNEIVPQSSVHDSSAAEGGVTKKQKVIAKVGFDPTTSGL